MEEKRRRIRLYCGVAGAAALVGLVGYQTCRKSDVYRRSVGYLRSLKESMEVYADAWSTGGELVRRVVKDLEAYMSADGEDVPRSLVQLARLVQSEEFGKATTRVVRAACEGVVGVPGEEGVGVGGEQWKTRDEKGGGGVVDKVLDALLSERGQSLVSVAVSMGARNIVSSYVESTAAVAAAGRDDVEPADKFLAFLGTAKGQQLAVACVSACANNAMQAYMEQTVNVNYYDDMFASMANPSHLDVVKQCISLFVKDAVSAYLNQQPGARNNPQLGSPKFVKEEVNDASYCCVRDDMNDTSSSGTVDSSSRLRGVEPTLLGPTTRVPDDVDSDCILYSTRAITTKFEDLDARPSLPSRGEHVANDAHGVGGRDDDARGADRAPSLVSALGREWVNVTKSQHSRDAIVAVMGSVTREAVGAATNAVADRVHFWYFVIVLLMGIISAVLVQLLLLKFAMSSS